MIVVTLMGGMGNQMFQYALGRSLSIKYNRPLKIDLSFLKRKDMGPKFIYRDYDLDLFNVYEDFDINQIGYSNYAWSGPNGSLVKINEPHYQYSEMMMKSIGDSISSNPEVNFLISGYWQTPLYFKDIESQIRKDFTFKDDIDNSDDYIKDMLEKIRSTNSVLLNIRRTDYLNTNYHGVMGNEYLDKGVELIESKVENPHYFVFSDDVEWCKENIKYTNMTIVDHSYKGDRFGYYLQLMKNCKHFIIPNSSFAWWAAWLNEDPNKIVITPKQWFTDSNINTNDLIPYNWIRI